MQFDKVRRHRAILDSIRGEVISSQAELREKLLEQGFEVTQATLSRDLRELGIVRRVLAEGGYKYTASMPTPAAPVVTCRASRHLLVIRTEVGYAPRLAYQIDAMGFPEVLGTVAGEDTLFVAIDDHASPSELEVRIMNALSI